MTDQEKFANWILSHVPGATDDDLPDLMDNPSLQTLFDIDEGMKRLQEVYAI